MMALSDTTANIDKMVYYGTNMVYKLFIGRKLFIPCIISDLMNVILEPRSVLNFSNNEPQTDLLALHIN